MYSDYVKNVYHIHVAMIIIGIALINEYFVMHITLCTNFVGGLWFLRVSVHILKGLHLQGSIWFVAEFVFDTE